MTYSYKCKLIRYMVCNTRREEWRTRKRTARVKKITRARARTLTIMVTRQGTSQYHRLHFSCLTVSINLFMFPEFAHWSSWHMSWLVHRRCTYALDIYNESPMRPPHGGPNAHFLRDLHCLHYWTHCFPGLPHKLLHRRPQYRHSCACSLYRLPAELLPVSGATQLRRWWVGFYPNLCSKVTAAHCNLVKFC